MEKAANFERISDNLRMQLGIPDDDKLDAIDVLRRAKFGGVIPDWQVVDDSFLPNAEAMWVPGRGIILRASLVVRAESDDPEARFTVMHELSHAVLGHGQRNRRPDGRTQFGRYVEQDERDADFLALALLAPARLAHVDQTTTAASVMARFGLTSDKANIRTEDLKRRHRKANNIQRQLPRTIDTGDYDEAFTEMLRNARRWNDLG